MGANGNSSKSSKQGDPKTKGKSQPPVKTDGKGKLDPGNTKKNVRDETSPSPQKTQISPQQKGANADKTKSQPESSGPPAAKDQKANQTQKKQPEAEKPQTQELQTPLKTEAKPNPTNQPTNAQANKPVASDPKKDEKNPSNQETVPTNAPPTKQEQQKRQDQSVKAPEKKPDPPAEKPAKTETKLIVPAQPTDKKPEVKVSQSPIKQAEGNLPMAIESPKILNTTGLDTNKLNLQKNTSKDNWENQPSQFNLFTNKGVSFLANKYDVDHGKKPDAKKEAEFSGFKLSAPSFEPTWKTAQGSQSLFNPINTQNQTKFNFGQKDLAESAKQEAPKINPFTTQNPTSGTTGGGLFSNTNQGGGSLFPTQNQPGTQGQTAGAFNFTNKSTNANTNIFEKKDQNQPQKAAQAKDQKEATKPNPEKTPGFGKLPSTTNVFTQPAKQGDAKNDQKPEDSKKAAPVVKQVDKKSEDTKKPEIKDQSPSKEQVQQQATPPQKPTQQKVEDKKETLQPNIQKDNKSAPAKPLFLPPAQDSKNSMFKAPQTITFSQNDQKLQSAEPKFKPPQNTNFLPQPESQKTANTTVKNQSEQKPPSQEKAPAKTSLDLKNQKTGEKVEKFPEQKSPGTKSGEKQATKQQVSNEKVEKQSSEKKDSQSQKPVTKQSQDSAKKPPSGAATQPLKSVTPPPAGNKTQQPPVQTQTQVQKPDPVPVAAAANKIQQNPVQTKTQAQKPSPVPVATPKPTVPDQKKQASPIQGQTTDIKTPQAAPAQKQVSSTAQQIDTKQVLGQKAPQTEQNSQTGFLKLQDKNAKTFVAPQVKSEIPKLGSGSGSGFGYFNAPTNPPTANKPNPFTSFGDKQNNVIPPISAQSNQQKPNPNQQPAIGSKDKPELKSQEKKNKEDDHQIKSNKQIDEEKKEGENPGMKKMHGQILNEDGEWVEYVEEEPVDKPPIAYTYMGSDYCPIEPNSEVVDFCMQYRIPKIEGLENCKTLKKLGLRKNLIEKIENIEHCTELQELELYDNRLTQIENLSTLTNLVILDLAFNSIKEVTPGCLDTLVNLKKLYLSANRIKKIQGLDKLRSLECLDMGDNKIRKIENLEALDLKELHLAKNKIQVIENVSHLKNMYMLTLQANFIEEITGLDEIVCLEQLYFQQNKIKKISGLNKLKKLEILDLAINEIEVIEGLEAMGDTIDELWINNNKIKDWSSIEYLGKTLKKIRGLYISVNPVYSKSQEFKQKLQQAVPSLKEVEGVPFNRPQYYITNPAGVSGIVKKGINPKAKSILDDILGKTASDEYANQFQAQQDEDKQLQQTKPIDTNPMSKSKSSTNDKTDQNNMFKFNSGQGSSSQSGVAPPQFTKQSSFQPPKQQVTASAGNAPQFPKLNTASGNNQFNFSTGNPLVTQQQQKPNIFDAAGSPKIEMSAFNQKEEKQKVNELRQSESQRQMENKIKEMQIQNEMKRTQTTNAETMKKIETGETQQKMVGKSMTMTNQAPTIENLSSIKTEIASNQMGIQHSAQGLSGKQQSEEIHSETEEEFDMDIDAEDDVSPEEIHALELELKQLEEEEIKYLNMMNQDKPVNEQVKELNVLIEKEKEEIKEYEQKIEAEKQKCRQKQRDLAIIKISLELHKKQQQNPKLLPHELQKMILLELKLEHDVYEKELKILQDSISTQKKNIIQYELQQKQYTDEIQFLQIEIDEEKKKYDQFKSQLPPNTEMNQKLAKEENDWQIYLRQELQKCMFNVATKEICDKIGAKMEKMEFQCDEWCHNYGYKPIMDIDIMKKKFDDDEVTQLKTLQEWKKNIKNDSQMTVKKLEETKQNIANLQAQLVEHKRLSQLLDEDLLDMMQIEKEMIQVCESESCPLQSVVEKVIVKNQDRYYQMKNLQKK